MKPLVLIVDDERLQREIMQAILEAHGYETILAASGREALETLQTRDPDVILSDLRMAELDGMELLARLPEKAVPPAVILVTAHGTIASAVEAVKQGAFDYLTKPLDKERILLAVRKACQHSAIRRENLRLRKELFGRFSLEGIIAHSPAMQQVVGLLKKVAGASTTVMLRGESGTGKELVARAIHYNSPRKNKPFTALNCAAIPENLFESELFGHEKGAFTGANGRHLGLIEVTNGGTLLLDEIGDMPLAMQAKLLRVLQEGEVRRVGARDALKVDVRIISATNKDLEKAVENGTFREDLYYRLNVVFVDLPPLRQRPEDIPPLIEHFLHRFSTQFGKQVREVRPETLKALLAYPWPGNVRQLQGVLERAVLFNDSGALGPTDIGPLLKAPPAPGSLGLELPKEGLDFEALEKELIQQALARSRGVATRAARLLRMNYKAFLYRMEKFDLKVHED